MTSKMYIDDNILIFDKKENEDPAKPYNIYINITINDTNTVAKLVSSEIVSPFAHLYFENHISLNIRKINNQVHDYKLFLNVITYQNFIKKEHISNYKYNVDSSRLLNELYTFFRGQINPVKCYLTPNHLQTIQIALLANENGENSTKDY